MLEYCDLLYKSGKFNEVHDILSDFFKISMEDPKKYSKAILAQLMLICVNILSKNWNEIPNNVLAIFSSLRLMKDIMDSEYKNINFELVNI